MKIVSWNVNGIRAAYKKGLTDFIESEKPDILCLQETKAHIDQVEDAAKHLGFQTKEWSSAIRKGYSGVATFTHKAPLKFSKGWGQTEYDSEGRIVISSFPEFELYNIYFPNGGSGETRHDFKQQFLKDLNAHLKPLIRAGKKIIVVGDYNVAPHDIDVHDPKKLSAVSGFLPEERAWFQSFFKLGFIDTFRHFHPGEEGRYSWWSYRELARISNRGWRIDFVCITENLLPNLVSAEIHDQAMGSDHCPVSVVMRF